jgi:putative nucleotidyltransferase with HDIG domain
VPLITKGQVKGVLEIFHRSAFEPDAEWFDFLNALAGQTAIAIENATLFDGLQRSNSELALAYDSTIEGWSRALDLRDQETEWHTLRVTEMSIKLARAFGLNDSDLIQVRWGALLHDIGKMGVPDRILHKPGPLNEEEWVIMRKHPVLAHDLLAPIRYLRLALDIPYSHHEKWDGSGYPNGSQGNQIPLIARLFAVADVWDALTSDRPYRLAWSEERAREHIQASSGTHFDPQVVELFTQIFAV